MNAFVLQIDAKPLRAELVPVTAAALERIKLLLLNMARQVGGRHASCTICITHCVAFP
jgi:hypothetical protein